MAETGATQDQTGGVDKLAWPSPTPGDFELTVRFNAAGEVRVHAGIPLISLDGNAPGQQGNLKTPGHTKPLTLKEEMIYLHIVRYNPTCVFTRDGRYFCW